MTATSASGREVVTDYLRALAESIERDWSRRGATLAAFADCACASLILLPPAGTLTTEALVEYALGISHPLPRQTHGEEEFADPSITLHRSEKFSIEVNFWTDSTTAIHQHAFAGAFAVLEGKSVHTVWDFARDSRPSPGLLIGRVYRKHSELLQPGDVRAIEAGSRFAHSLFHLTRPAVTFVIRTDSKALRDPEPPYIYLPPRLAIDPFLRDETFQRQLKLIAFRRSSGTHAEAIDYFLDRANLTPISRVRLLQYAVDCGFSGRICRRIAERSAIDAPVLRGAIEETAEVLLRQRSLVQLRTRVQDEEGRLLLSLALLVDDYESAASMLSAMGVAAPARFVADQVWRLASELGGDQADRPCGYEDRAVRLWLEGYDDEASAAILRETHPGVSAGDVRAVQELVSEIPAFRALLPSRHASAV